MHLAINFQHKLRVICLLSTHSYNVILYYIIVQHTIYPYRVYLLIVIPCSTL